MVSVKVVYQVNVLELEGVTLVAVTRLLLVKFTLFPSHIVVSRVVIKEAVDRGFTVIVPVAFTVPQPPVKGIV